MYEAERRSVPGCNDRASPRIPSEGLLATRSFRADPRANCAYKKSLVSPFADRIFLLINKIEFFYWNSKFYVTLSFSFSIRFELKTYLLLRFEEKS